MKYILCFVLFLMILVSYIFNTRKKLDKKDIDSIENLKSHGYVLYRNVLDKDTVESFKNTITDELDYSEGKDYIDKNLLPIIRNTFDKSAEYKKFRISNNDNSTDAGSFHRDINHFSYKKEGCPLYTALNSLDGSIMEIIPDTHNKPKMKLLESLKSIRKKRYISINPTDLLIFNANILHRGIFDIKQPNRRLIQIFEIYPNKEIYNEYDKKIQTINMSKENKKINILPTIVKIPILKDSVNFYEYLRMSTQSFIPKGIKKYLWKNADDFYSTHEHTGRIIPKKGIKNKTNLHVINNI